jgi:hypothetical protein
MPLLRRRRAGANVGPKVGTTQRQPHAGILRRERRALLRAREVELRNLGGLVAEMYRRGATFRDDLLSESCAQVVGIDARIGEIDEILNASAATCTCGAPVYRGSHFCANCGRTVDAPAKNASVEDTVVERAAREDA